MILWQGRQIDHGMWLELDERGSLALWRRTTIPAVARKTDAARGQE